jgi:hypothetical protein
MAFDPIADMGKRCDLATMNSRQIPISTFEKFNSLKLFLQNLRAAFLVMLGLLLFPSDALSMKLRAKDRFGEIGAVNFNNLLDALPIKIPADPKHVRMLKLIGGKSHINRVTYDVILVRFENFCASHRCLTAIFVDRIDRSSFRGLMRLPAEMTRGDMGAVICDKCPARGSVYVFESPEAGSTILIPSEFGPIFQ